MPSTCVKNQSNQQEIIIDWAVGMLHGHGFHGDVILFDAAGEKLSCKHVVDFCHSEPMGMRHLYLDLVGVGAWATLELPGFDITEADLYWATGWAQQAIAHRHAVMPCEIEMANQR